MKEQRTLWKLGLVLAALAALVAVPFALKPRENLLGQADDTLVIISPHNEAVRYEFTLAFARYYKAKTGRSVLVDWRLPGGTSEISRLLSSEYLAAFERAWKSMGKPWTQQAASAFDNSQVVLPNNPEADTPVQAARRTFLNSSTGIGIDLYFGGGSFDFAQQASAGRLVASGLPRLHPDWFEDRSFPQNVSGEPFRDPQARWLGACLSSFGICYNTDSLRRLGFLNPPTKWSDLDDPRYFKQVALADPNKSGSVGKAFEMVIQQQMREAVEQSGTESQESLSQGWLNGLRIIQQASANARYFTDSATKVPLEVAQGDAAIGMCIDFYGRFQSEMLQAEAPAPVGGLCEAAERNLRKLSGSHLASAASQRPPTGAASRLQFFTPAGGSSFGVDPIGILRGAPHRQLGEQFIEFVLSVEGQKIWNFKVGAPGGPEKYALRRLPIRRELYLPEYARWRSDPEVMPYEEAKGFIYHPAWTSPLFRVIGFIVRAACVDPHEEQAQAWEALRNAGFPKQALQTFSDLSAVSYEVAWNRIKPALSSRDRVAEARLAKDLSAHFREQYRQAAQLAKEGK